MQRKKLEIPKTNKGEPMKAKGNHPLAEIIAKCLSGINSVPPEYRDRMINRAVKQAVKWHEEQMKPAEAKK